MTKSSGIVYLVGGGPGDPGLITVAGVERLRRADVVVYDRLIHPALLTEAPPQALLIDVGKRPDHHPVPQDDINQVLIEHARAGRLVVRLKGGDPFVFGRGGEEAEALAHAGIPFEVVPGVSSVVAAPAYAGIPLTHRNLACSFSVITGHRKAEREDEIACDWQRAAGADTLVFLMGVTALPSIVARLLEMGKGLPTPAAVIERGTFNQQRTVTGTLGDIVEAVTQAKIKPPATLVVGDVVTLREDLDWFRRSSQRPLFGLCVLNTRAFEDGRELSEALTRLGAEVIHLPATQLAPPDDSGPLDAAISAICASGASAPAFDWIGFTSAHAVRAFMARFMDAEAGGRRGAVDARRLAGIRLAAVGPATAAALRPYGLMADLVPDRAAGRHLAASLGEVAGQRILLPRSDIALRDLPDALRARGAHVSEVVAYTTRPASAHPLLLQRVTRGEVDAACFFSPSAVQGLAAQLAPQTIDELMRNTVAVCVGETTTRAAKEAGFRGVHTAAEAATESMVQSLTQWYLEKA